MVTIAELIRRLRGVHGRVEYPESGPVLDELIATVLSQNTTDANSSTAYEELVRRFPTWEAVRHARTDRLAATIRRAGLQQQKARCIKQILQSLGTRQGELTLEFVREMAADDALAFLRGFPGVGPKTAACVLLFACRLPVLPVDTHVHRLSVRLGLVPAKTSAEKAHTLLAGMVRPRQVLDFHLLLIRHGRRVCHAQRPDCPACVLIDVCPEGRQQLQHRGFDHS